MKRISRLALFFVASFFSISLGAPDAIKDLKPTVILVSLDGYRYDYNRIYKPQNICSIAEKGVQAQWMIPVFPTKTFPNHYSIATGLYAEHHGIVGNTMYDPEFKAVFSLGNREEVQNPRWWHGEPIWVTAEKQNIKTASYYYPGSETKIDRIQPAYWRTYDDSIPNSERVNQILAWLDLPVTERPQLITLYFSDLDDAGHEYSPDSSAIGISIAHVDSCIGQLLNGLKERKIEDQVNLMILSDHGMATVEPGNIIVLDDYINTDQTEKIINEYQLVHIFPKEGKEDSVYQGLTNNVSEHFTCYRKDGIPDRYHYKNNRRIGPILCVADEGWVLMERSSYEELDNKNELPTHPTGAHGYDNQLESMR
ncbi:MAG: alkaline phosphatase family protein, partial [Calditrichaceae bacterium]